MRKNTLKKILATAMISGTLCCASTKANAFDATNTVAEWISSKSKSISADDSQIFDNYQRATCTGNYGKRKFSSRKCNPAKLTIDEQIEILRFSVSRRTPIKTFELLDAIAGDYTPEQQKRLEQLVREKENIMIERNFCIADKNIEQVEYVNGNKLTPMESIFATSEKYYEFVKNIAEQHNIPYQAMVGIMVIENGGGTNKVSNSGCVGLFQFARATEKSIKKYANKQLGFKKYNPEIDQRRDPYVSAEIAGWLLDYNHKLFGRWDFAIQSYHDGETYLGKRVRQYVKNHFGYTATKKDSLGSLVKNYDLKLVDILTDKNITFTNEAHNYYSGTILMFDSFTNKMRTMNYLTNHCGRKKSHKYVKK